MFVTLQVGKTFATTDKVYRAGEVIEVSDDVGASLLSEMADVETCYFAEVGESAAANALVGNEDADIADAPVVKTGGGKKLTLGKAASKHKPKVNDGDVITV